MQLIPLPFSRYRQVPWRNGGGSARDIAVHPVGASMADPFGWRVALAEIEHDGPFSHYEPDIERIITLLDGAGFELEFEEAHGISLSEPHMPARFRGHWQTSCRLKGGRCIVINILYDDRAFSSQTHIIRPVADQPMVFSPPGRQSILFCLNGRFEIKTEDPALQQQGSPAPDQLTSPLQLAPWDSLQIDLQRDEAPLFTMTASIPESRLLLIGFDPLESTLAATDQAMREALARTA
jgi:environmental stress-induced protein Ves